MSRRVRPSSSTTSTRNRLSLGEPTPIPVAVIAINPGGGDVGAAAGAGTGAGGGAGTGAGAGMNGGELTGLAPPLAAGIDSGVGNAERGCAGGLAGAPGASEPGVLRGPERRRAARECPVGRVHPGQRETRTGMANNAEFVLARSDVHGRVEQPDARPPATPCLAGALFAEQQDRRVRRACQHGAARSDDCLLPSCP